MKNPPLFAVALVLLSCDPAAALDEILGGPGTGTGQLGSGGAGGADGDDCGLSREQLEGAYLVPLSSKGTAGAAGQPCPALQPVQGSGYDTFDPGPEAGPCGRHPEMRIQPARVPCAEPGESVSYRLTLSNQNDPRCPAISWRFSSAALSSSVADVSPSSATVRIDSGRQAVVCLEVTSAAQQDHEQESSRVDFAFESPGNTRQGALWHTVHQERGRRK